MSIPTSRDKRRALFTLSLRKVLIAFTALLFSYFLFLWFTISKHIDYHISVSQHDFRPQAQVKKNTSTKNTTDSVITIGIASTVTGCGEDPFTEGAAVLKYSIELTSIHGQKGGKYDYKFYIMYHSQAKECVLPLKELGFILLERPTPVNVSEIEGYVLRERISSNGCCGEKELIKLEAYRLTQHPVVIHLDLDVLVLHPMDSAIDLVLNPERYIENPSNKRDSDVPFMWPDLPIPDDISLLFTKDYNVSIDCKRNIW